MVPLPVAIMHLHDHSGLANMNLKKDLSLREIASIRLSVPSSGNWLSGLVFVSP